MDIFILAAIFGAAVTLIALVASVRDAQGIINFSLGNIHAEVPRRVLGLFAITVASILILIVAFIAIGPLHPRETAVYGVAQFIQSRRFFSTLLGLLFGVFLVFWTRQLLLLKPSESITWVHRGEAIFLVLLLLLGSLSDQISSFAHRLTQFSAGGLTLTFETLKRGGSFDRGQQGRGGATVVKGQSATALIFLSGLHGENGIRDRDRRYAEYSKDKNKLWTISPTPYVADPDDAFFQETIGDMAGCLNGIASDSSSDEDVNGYVRRLRPTLREFVIGHPDADDSRRIEEIAEEFVDASMDLLRAIARTYLRRANDHRNTIVDKCHPLIKLRCPDAESAWRPGVDAYDRASALVGAIDRCKDEHSNQVERLAETISRALAGKTLFYRPYLNVFYASLLWRLDDFEGAVRVLEDWLRAAKSRGVDSPEARWDLIRVRSTLIVVMEDWIRSEDNPAPLILVHHLANLVETIDRMRNEPIVMAAWEGFTKNKYDVVGEHFAEPLWPMDCSLNDEQIRLASILMQQHMAYAYRATQHPDYFDSYAREVVMRRDAIMKINLSCLAKSDPAATKLLYAEVLQVYGEVEIANAVRIARLPDADEARRRLQHAADAAMLGSEMIADYARTQQTDAQTQIVRDQKATELKYLLRQVQQRAQEALGQ